MVTCLPPLRTILSVRCPTLEVEGVDVGAEGFGDPQPVEGQQRRQGVVTGRSEAGLDEEGPELIAVQPQGP